MDEVICDGVSYVWNGAYWEPDPAQPNEAFMGAAAWVMAHLETPDHDTAVTLAAILEHIDQIPIGQRLKRFSSTHIPNHDVAVALTMHPDPHVRLIVVAWATQHDED